MERVALDIMGPLNETERQKSYVLVIKDYFTKWVEAFPLANDKAETVAEVLASEWVCRYGAPQVLHSDQGRNFESEVFQKMCCCLALKRRHRTISATVRWPGGMIQFHSKTDLGNNS